MKYLSRFKKLDQRGFDHILLGVAFATIIGISGVYYFVASHAAPWSGALSLGSTSSGWCMEDQSGGTSNGTYVVLDKCNNQQDQKWTLNSVSKWNGHPVYTIQTAKANLCIDNWNQSKAIGGKNLLRMYKCNGKDAAQQFVWTNVNNKHGLLNIQTDHVIDNFQGRLTVGNHLDLYTAKTSGYSGQEWFEIGNSTAGSSSSSSSSSSSTSPTHSTSTSGTTAALQLPLVNAAGYHMCLDDNNYSANNNNKVDVWQCNGTAAQTWTANGKGKNTVTIRGKCLEAYQNGTTNGTPIGIYTCNGTAGQKWTWKSGGGATTFVNSHSGKCLDDKGWSTTNGTQLELYTCNGGKNQLWYPVTPSTSNKK